MATCECAWYSRLCQNRLSQRILSTFCFCLMELSAQPAKTWVRFYTASVQTFNILPSLVLGTLVAKRRPIPITQTSEHQPSRTVVKPRKLTPATFSCFAGLPRGLHGRHSVAAPHSFPRRAAVRQSEGSGRGVCSHRSAQATPRGRGGHLGKLYAAQALAGQAGGSDYREECTSERGELRGHMDCLQTVRNLYSTCIRISDSDDF